MGDTLNLILKDCLYVCLTIIIPLIAKRVMDYIDGNQEQLTKQIEDDHARELVNNAIDIVQDIVNSINQTFVDSLKATGSLTKENAEKAKAAAVAKAQVLISEESKMVIRQLYGSVDIWLDTQIENAVANAKKEKAE